MTCGTPRPEGGWGQLLGAGDILDRRYLIERCLAVGGAGLTYLAMELNENHQPIGPKLAIKVLYNARAKGTFLRRLANEAQILQQLAHEHIVQYHGFVQRSGTEPYLVTLFEEGGNLTQHVDNVGPLPAPVAAGILKQVLLALDVAHQRGVVHRDLKPDNVLLYSSTVRERMPAVRVADFGIAKISGSLTDKLTKIGSFIGTPEYAAPEQFEGQDPTTATDVFATGALLVYLVTGLPWIRFGSRSDIAGAFEELMDNLPPKVTLPENLNMPLHEKTIIDSVIQKMMRANPEARATIHEVLADLRPLLEGNTLEHLGTLEFTEAGAPNRNKRAPAAVTFSMDPREAAGLPVINPSAPTVPRLPAAGRRAKLAPLGPDDSVTETSETGWVNMLRPPPLQSLELEPTQAGSTRRVAAPAIPPTVPGFESPDPPIQPTPAPVAARNTPAPAKPTPTTEAGVDATPAPAKPAQPPAPPKPLGSTPPQTPAPSAFVEEAPPAGAGVLGCMGISMAGAMVSLAGSALVIGLIWGGAATALGFFAPAAQGPAVHAEVLPPGFEDTRKLNGRGERAEKVMAKIDSQLRERAPAISKKCKATGKVQGDLLIAQGGDVDFTHIVPGTLQPSAVPCVVKELGKETFQIRVPEDVRYRFSLNLP